VHTRSGFEQNPIHEILVYHKDLCNVYNVTASLTGWLAGVAGTQDRVTTGPRAYTVLGNLMQEVPTSQPNYAWFQQQTEGTPNAGTRVTVDVHAMLQGTPFPP